MADRQKIKRKIDRWAIKWRRLTPFDFSKVRVFLTYRGVDLVNARCMSSTLLLEIPPVEELFVNYIKNWEF